MGFGSLANLIGKGIGFAVKNQGKISKAFGAINNASKTFGQLSQSGRSFGSLADKASGGRLGQSKFGRSIENLVDKADTANNKISSVARQGDGQVNEAIDRLKRY